MTKRAMITLLIGVNLLLLIGLLLASWQPAAAFAQAAPLGRNFSMVAGEIRDGVDAVYIIDLPQRRMHVFVPNRDQNNRRLFHAGFVDLQRDFHQCRAQRKLAAGKRKTRLQRVGPGQQRRLLEIGPYAPPIVLIGILSAGGGRKH